MKILAVYNMKGGVGKTATAVNLAHLSAASGARTLLWDLDPQGAATFYFRIQPRIKGGAKKLIRGRKPLDGHIRGSDFDGLDLLPSDFSYRHLDLLLDKDDKPHKRLGRLLRPLASDYDHVFLDCAPSISLVSEGVFSAADALLVPTMPTTLSLRTLDQLRDYLVRKGPRKLQVLPFYCIVDRRKSMHREISGRKAGGSYEFLDSWIPYSSLVEQMGVHRAPLAEYAGTSAVALAYETLWREVVRKSGSDAGSVQDISRVAATPDRATSRGSDSGVRPARD